MSLQVEATSTVARCKLTRRRFQKRPDRYEEPWTLDGHAVHTILVSCAAGCEPHQLVKLVRHKQEDWTSARRCCRLDDSG